MVLTFYDYGVDVCTLCIIICLQLEKEKSQSVQGGATLLSKIKAAIRKSPVDPEPRCVQVWL